jgi:hypothetical protein
MKTVNTSATQSPSNKRLVLILIGVVIALICIAALGLELRTLLPTFSEQQTSSNWFSMVASQTIQWLNTMMIALV